MALTNFASLTTNNKLVWSRDLWKAARNTSFINRFVGKGPNALVQRITELTKTERGDRAVLTLVSDLDGDGIAGDNELEGNEGAVNAYDQTIRIDQLRNANRHRGRMTEQKSVVNFRETSRDVLAYWLADRIDQLAFLTMSGVSYAYKTNGAARSGSQLAQLDFAADVTAPSTNRYRNWDYGTLALTAGNTANIDATDTPSYRMLVQLKAYAKDNFIRGIKADGGEEVYHCFMTPQQMARLKVDADYLANVRYAGVRGGKNELFAGTTSVMVDGIWIHEYRHVFNTSGLASGSKWGAGSAIDGARLLFCGAQALGMVDLGAPNWVEEGHDYENQQAIAIDKIFGFKKPVFKSQVTATDEDFGLIAVNTAF